MAADQKRAKKKGKSAAGDADAPDAADTRPATEQKQSPGQVVKADVPASTDQPPAAGSKSKKRRKRKVAGVEEAALPADEAARRRRQRELRELALRLREQGREYDPRKHRKHKPRRRVALIIVPIFWNKKLAEKAAVLEAAEHVQALLRGAGVKCDTDTTTELTPGQKMRHWEEKGVKLRVELGGVEAEAGTAVVARCTTPGEVAQKKTVKVGQPLLDLVLRHMHELGIPLHEPAAAAAGAAGGEAAPEAVAGGRGGEAATPEGQQDGEAQPAARQATAQQPAKQRGVQEGGPSGDALDGDFAGLPLLPQQAPGKKGKKRQEAAAVAAAELAQSVFGQGEEETGQKKKKKKPKVVTF